MRATLDARVPLVTDWSAIVGNSRGGRWQPPWRNPKAYALQLIGALIVFVGLVVVDSLLVALLGLAVILAAVYVSRRWPVK